MKFAAQVHTLRCRSPRIFVKGFEDAKAIYEAFLHDYAEVFSPVALAPSGGTSILNFALKTTVTQPKPAPLVFQSRRTNPKNAFLRNRAVFWEDADGFKDTPTYDMSLLKCGNIVEGPAIIEAADTTVVLPPGKQYVIDEYLNAVIKNIGT
jgi:N-methylhydantoinase A/acetophenone carboxylase